jgi:hypothetical protein
MPRCHAMDPTVSTRYHFLRSPPSPGDTVSNRIQILRSLIGPNRLTYLNPIQARPSVKHSRTCKGGPEPTKQAYQHLCERVAALPSPGGDPPSTCLTTTWRQEQPTFSLRNPLEGYNVRQGRQKLSAMKICATHPCSEPKVRALALHYGSSRDARLAWSPHSPRLCLVRLW